MARRKSNGSKPDSSANLGFEPKLWLAADKLRNNMDAAEYKHVVPGFCKSATTAEIAARGFVLTPGRYVGAEAVEDDGEPFEDKMTRLVAELKGQFAESAKLETEISTHLMNLGFPL